MAARGTLSSFFSETGWTTGDGIFGIFGYWYRRDFGRYGFRDDKRETEFPDSA